MSDDQGRGRVSACFPDLAGKTGIVTGTSRGIGCGIAEFLARQGMRLLTAARSAEAGEAFAARLRSSGSDVTFVAADLATPDGAAAVFDAALARFGRIHLLVNNAAHVRSKGILDLDETAYRESFEANMRMVYGLSRPCARHMAEAKGGCIITISSVGGLRPHRGLAGYDASKGALDALTRSMAVDLAPHGVRVNAVAPGATLSHAVRPEWEQRFHDKCAGIPLGRFGTVEEIGAAVAFLASDAAAYVTGQVLYVDGGLTTQLTPPGIYI